MQTKSDMELVRSYADSQDESAFGELAARYRQIVYRACLRMLGDAHEAQDATQAVFIVLARKAGRLRREGVLTGWLYDVSRKVALEALRRRANRTKREEDAAMWQETTSGESVSGANAEPVLKVVDEELAGLSAVLRQAVALRYLQGHGEREAAALVDCPLGTMKRRASEGIAKLRARLARRGIALGATALAGVLASEAQAAIPETLLPSIMTASKMAATGVAAGAGAAGGTAMTLANEVIKAMFWAKVKLAMVVASAAAVLGGGGTVALVAAGKVTPRVATVLPMEKVAEAHALVEAGDVVGRVVLKP